MPNFEGLIRPFQSQNISYPRRVIKPDAVPEEQENVVFEVKGGGSKSLGASYSYNLTTYMDKVQKEVTRPVEDDGGG